MTNYKVHVKTAGTSYLEALKAVAVKNPKLFREIFQKSFDIYEVEKKTYHVSADLDKIESIEKLKDSELTRLFESNDARQVMHVAFGRILTDKDENGNYQFKDAILNCLRVNEELYDELILEHFSKHFAPFT